MSQQSFHLGPLAPGHKVAQRERQRTAIRSLKRWVDRRRGDRGQSCCDPLTSTTAAAGAACIDAHSSTSMQLSTHPRPWPRITQPSTHPLLLLLLQQKLPLELHHEDHLKPKVRVATLLMLLFCCCCCCCAAAAVALLLLLRCCCCAAAATTWPSQHVPSEIPWTPWVPATWY